MRRIALVISAMLACCHPSPAYPVADADSGVEDADARSKISAACANLVAVGCLQDQSTCVATVQHVIDAKLTPVNLSCLTKKKTKEDLRQCGFVECR